MPLLRLPVHVQHRGHGRSARPWPLLALALVACAGAGPRSQSAAEPDAWLLMANPAEDASSAITIGWHARLPGTYVEITGDDDPSFRRPMRAEGHCEPLRHHDTATDMTYDELRCVARVSGLAPGAAYRYRAGREGFSSVNRFRTAAEGEPFSFLYMSDVHVHNPIPGRLGAAVASLDTARALAGDVHFTVFGGDMLAYGSAWDAWQSLTDSPLVRTQVTAFTPGNHEFYDNTATSRGPGYFNAFVYNPDNGAEGVENTSYHFQWGDVLFLSISSEDSWSSAELLGSQKRWFREAVETSEAGVVVAFTHRPFYNGSTGNAGHARTNRESWSPLFDELGVDLVLSGHDHVYVRTAPTYAGARSADPARGTVYLGSTAVGDRYREADPENPYTNIERIIGGDRTLGTIVTVDGSSLRLRTYDLSGAIVDEAVLRAGACPAGQECR